MTFREDVETAVAKTDFGRPTALKAGRFPQRPYVPVIMHPKPHGGERQRQIPNRAFAKAEDAVAFAQAVINHNRSALGRGLRDPRLRALRVQHGLPAELPAEEVA